MMIMMAPRERRRRLSQSESTSEGKAKSEFFAAVFSPPHAFVPLLFLRSFVLLLLPLSAILLLQTPV
jgi:hypothetical protein